MISHEQAQELHQCIGQGIERDGDYLVALDRALEIASVIVSDTTPPEPTGEFTYKQETLAECLMDLAWFPGKWDVNNEEIERASLSDDIELRDNYLKDADEILRSHPHLLGLDTREHMGLI